MNIREYHRLAMRTSPADGHDKIDNGILGLIGEVGELVDVYKKWIYQSTPGAQLPVDRIADELGDVLWYMTELADGLDLCLADLYYADFDALDQSVKKIKHMPHLRKVIMDMAEDAILIEKTTSLDRVIVFLDMMLEHEAHVARLIELPMAEIAQRNIDKLRKRYPV